MKISISSDHEGHQLRNILIDYLKFKEIEVIDFRVIKNIDKRDFYRIW